MKTRMARGSFRRLDGKRPENGVGTRKPGVLKPEARRGGEESGLGKTRKDRLASLQLHGQKNCEGQEAGMSTLLALTFA